MTYYTGFKVNSGEYKVMGLAPYGTPKYKNLIKDHLIDIKEDGSFALDMSYFNYCVGLTMTNEKFNKLFDGPVRKPESLITQKEMDLASSIQAVTEEVIIKLAKGIAKSTGQKNLCLAGGVALNCVANGKILQEEIFENIWVQPASGDAGGALGAAMAAHHIMLNNPRKTFGKDSMKGSFLGPSYSQDDVEVKLTKCGAIFETLTHEEIIEQTAHALADGKAVGWMNGRMEFGPRSLGGRSIIADPRSASMQKKLNLKVKFRESFRPFAPSVLLEDVDKWFQINCESPYMLFVTEIAKDKCKKMTKSENQLFGIDKLNLDRSDISAVTHVDYTARVQTVNNKTNPSFYSLIKKFKELTGCPVLVNTSFNIRGEPIICSPEDAFKCFMGTELDLLVIENSILYKSKQSQQLSNSYKTEYELD